MTFVDVGGNKGDFALLAAKAMGDRSRALCRTRARSTSRGFRKSVARNRYASVEVLRAALTESDGEETLFLGPKSGWHTLIEDPALVVGRLS